jgi:hypothetical protein
VTIYSKSGSILALAFDTEQYEAHHLILSEDIKPGEIYDRITFKDGVLVLESTEESTWKTAFVKKVPYPLIEYTLLINETSVLIEFTSSRESITQEFPLEDIRSRFGATDFAFYMYPAVSVKEGVISINMNSKPEISRVLDL